MIYKSDHAWIDDTANDDDAHEDGGMKTGLACDRYDINGMNH